MSSPQDPSRICQERLCRAWAEKGDQGRRRLRGRRVAGDPDRDSDLSGSASSRLGSDPRHSPHDPRFSDRHRAGLDLGAHAQRRTPGANHGCTAGSRDARVAIHARHHALGPGLAAHHPPNTVPRSPPKDESTDHRSATRQACRGCTAATRSAHPMNAILGYGDVLMIEAEELGIAALVPDIQRSHGAAKKLLEQIDHLLPSGPEAGDVDVDSAAYVCTADCCSPTAANSPSYRRSCLQRSATPNGHRQIWSDSSELLKRCSHSWNSSPRLSSHRAKARHRRRLRTDLQPSPSGRRASSRNTACRHVAHRGR